MNSGKVVAYSVCLILNIIMVISSRTDSSHQSALTSIAILAALILGEVWSTEER